MPPISFDILSFLPTGMGIDVFLKGGIIYILVVWIAFIVWVIRDITNRSESILMQTFCILIILIFTPIFGLPIYLLVRPRSTLFEKYYEQVELEEVEYTEGMHCKGCGNRIEKDFQYCPHCREELLVPCVSCKKLIHETWKACAYCGTNVLEEVTPPVKSKKSETSKKISITTETTEEIVATKDVESTSSESAKETKEIISEKPAVITGDIPEITVTKK